MNLPKGLHLTPDSSPRPARTNASQIPRSGPKRNSKRYTTMAGFFGAISKCIEKFIGHNSYKVRFSDMHRFMVVILALFCMWV